MRCFNFESASKIIYSFFIETFFSAFLHTERNHQILTKIYNISDFSIQSLCVKKTFVL